MKSKYSAENIFSDVSVQKFPRHKFNKSYFNKLTLNHGLAVPFFVDDVLPGDRFDLKTFGRIQLQPLASSSMQNMRCYFRYFYVPYRLLWENWDKFMTQLPNEETAILAPYTIVESSHLSSMARTTGLLYDYLGIGLTPGKTYNQGSRLQFNLFRFAAYQLIWNEYFRDENLQAQVGLNSEGEYLTDGYNDFHLYFNNLYTLLPVSYEKDYFTTALPFQQAGGQPVQLSAYVLSDSLRVTNGSYDFSLGVRTNLNIPGSDGAVKYYGDPVFIPDKELTYVNAQPELVNVLPESLATSFNINDLRYSNALQRFLERTALGGSRPAEYYLSMYGVRVDDLRIGRPFYLGGGYTNVTITDVASTAQTTDSDGNDIPQGTLSGNGKSFPAIQINHPYYCQEAGIVMGIMYIRPEINYMQGLPRQMQVFRKLDYYNPLFAHLGEEAVFKSELVIPDLIDNTTSETNNDDIFGYQSRYAYLKHKRNEVHGDFKSTLSKWVLSPILPDNVQLNDEFITVDQDYSIFAVTDSRQHHYLCELYNDYQVESSMPDFSVPSL